MPDARSSREPVDVASIVEAARDRRDDLVGLAQSLVSVDSVAGRETAAQDLVATELRGLELEVDVFACRSDDVVSHPAFTDDGCSPDDRVDVVGRWPGTGRGNGRSLILNGHVDVVPAGDRARWSRDPFGGEVVDGRLFGRGACDMKAGLAAAVAAVRILQDVGVRPSADVLVQSVVGEETGGIGTLACICRGYRADAAIILEPTNLRPRIVQSGALTFRLEVEGRPAHGALRREGVSAIDRFVALTTALHGLEAERHGDFGDADLFDDPLGVAPISVGTISGGEWHSSVPGSVVAEGRMGVFPGETVASARAAFEDALLAAEDDPWSRAHPPRVAWIEGQFEPGGTARDHPIVGCLSDAHRAVTGEDADPAGVPYGSDLRLFTEHAGTPAVLYGPGDIRLAHAYDEHVLIDEVVTAAASIAVTVAMWSG